MGEGHNLASSSLAGDHLVHLSMNQIVGNHHHIFGNHPVVGHMGLGDRDLGPDLERKEVVLFCLENLHAHCNDKKETKI